MKSIKKTFIVGAFVVLVLFKANLLVFNFIYAQEVMVHDRAEQAFEKADNLDKKSRRAH